MDPRLHEYLEGERRADTLTPDERKAAAAWDGLLETARQEERLPPWMEGRVMQAIGARETGRAWPRWLEALARPRMVSVRPVTLLGFGLLAALILTVWSGWRSLLPVSGPDPVAVTPAPQGEVLVQFTFEAPRARSVSVAGSFNGWKPEATLLSDPDGDGIWSALIALAPGVHQYMFVVDGVEWVADPRAEQFVGDGFGRDNAVLTVGPASIHSL